MLESEPVRERGEWMPFAMVAVAVAVRVDGADGAADDEPATAAAATAAVASSEKEASVMAPAAWWARLINDGVVRTHATNTLLSKLLRLYLSQNW